VIKDFKLEAGSVKNIAPPQIEAIKNIIFKCITSDISARYQSIDELLNALVRFVSDQINKTDVLTSMQVDPSKFMRTGADEVQADKKTQDGKGKNQPSFADFKVPAFKGPGDTTQNGNSDFPLNLNSGKEKRSGAPANDEAAYDILFGKKNAREMKTVAYGGDAKSAGEDASGENPFMARENSQQYDQSENEDSAEAPACSKTAAGGRSADGEMWSNKKTAGAKSLLAKIANFWYSMLFVITGFLSFLLYVFW
jgi:hypothetical protein